MIDTKPLPSLSADGWVYPTSMKCDYLLSHFFLSEYSRTYLHYGNISSFPWLLQNYKDDMPQLKEKTRETLETYFKRYFPAAEAQVEIKNEGGSKYGIHIYVSVTDSDGKEFSLGRVAEVLDAKILKVAYINNYGADE